MLLGKSSSGKPAALAGGKEIADLSTAPVLDAKEMAAPGTGKVGTATASITGSSDNTTLALTPDAAFMADPTVTFPVTVAASNPTPWHGAGAPTDTFIANGGSYTSGSFAANMTALFAGRRDGFNYRSYLKFNLDGAPFIGQPILDANIILWNYLSHQCGSNVGDIALHRISSSWAINTLTWSNQPSAVGDGHVVNSDGLDQSCSGWMDEGELWYSIEQITQAWSDGQPNHGIMIRAVSESGANNWRQYLSGNWAGGSDGSHHPFFFVEYEAPTPSYLIASWTYTDEERIDTYDEAIAAVNDPGRVRAFTELNTGPPIDWEDAYDQKASSTEPLTTTADELLNGPQPEDPPPPSPEPGDTTPPQVLQTTPAPAAVDVPVDTQVTVTFSEPVTDAQFSLTDLLGEGQVAGTTTMSADNQVLTFTLSQPLTGTYYEAMVSGAKDAAGNVMAAPYIWQFTTIIPVPEPSPTPTPSPSPSPTPVAGLVAAYGMEEGSGTVVADSSGQGNTGAAGDTTWAAGKYGQALSFNGSSSWVTVNHANSLRLTTGMTLSAWVRPTTVSSWRTAVMKELADGLGAAYGLYASNGTGPSGWLQTGFGEESFHTVDGVTPLPVNTWSHVAVTYNGTTAQLYVGGTQVAQTPVSGTLTDDGSPLRIGGNNVWGEFFNGQIDEVRVYNRAQTATEIQTDMNTPIGGAAPFAPGAFAETRSRTVAVTAPRIAKLAVSGTSMRNGTTSTLTPELTAWVAGPNASGATIDVEIAHKPAKSSNNKQRIWSGQATLKSSDSHVSLRVPEGKLPSGQTVRWRARATAGGVAGEWSAWQSINVTSSSLSASEPAQAVDSVAVASLTPPLAVNEHPRMTPAQCENNEILARRARGWTMNRYSWCTMADADLTETKTTPEPTVVKHFEAELMFIGYTFNGVGSLGNEPSATSRDVYIDVHVKIEKAAAPVVALYNMKIGVMPADSECEHVTQWNGSTHHNNLQKLLFEWQTGDTYRFHLRCPATNARAKRSVVWDQDDEYTVILDNTERVTLGKFKLYLQYPDLAPVLANGAWQVANSAGERETFVQCDSASYFGRGSGGCVFGDVTSSLQHELGKGYDAAYHHYWNACYESDDTYPVLQRFGRFPAVQNKSIPGCLDSDRVMKYNYLHRIDTAVGRSNRDSITRPYCTWLWGSNTGGTSGNECDEFPFASTWERWNNPYPGANVTRAGYSLCPIPAGDNGLAGTLLGSFYGKERILVGDPFFIKFKTALSDPQKCMTTIPGHN